MAMTWTTAHWQFEDADNGVTASLIRTKGIGTERRWHLVVQSPNRDINALSNTYWPTALEAKDALEQRIGEATT